ncbi:hypothetical protein P170DRAFT_360870 [Aspergillus steynii IBT 23096]|uniref:Cupin type-2 domain-containing protein n=1 Tax=Aspergillus steynii IBT 23096 TaxID=1392250 RepID=A0A2I2G443_9EURO|nr:uncharacterized protein P170DRAFT_360870 [Aspergillus steynii IBT 23096]PLB47650.1 hypothetical protein P170DRAFT_360870 [Aspergillus steynii IBT 23096]
MGLSGDEPLRRIVTTHQDSRSAILFDNHLEPTEGFAAKAATIWMTRQYPAELTSLDASTDPRSRQMYSRGSLIRVVDFPPHSVGHNHRTQSLDYAIIMDGEMEMQLDDGSRTKVQAGDVVVQQATMHQWHNVTDRVARVIFVLLPSEPFVVGEALRDKGIPGAFQVLH